MTKSRTMAAFRAYLVLTLAVMIAFPTAAFAAQADVRVSEYNTSQDARQPVTKLNIEDVEKPATGSELDSSARVTTAEGKSWEIPILWIDSNLQPATKAVAGETYLPVFAFYLPADYAIGDADNAGAFTVTFSPEITALLGTENIISIYDAETGITYLLPSSIRSSIDAKLAASAAGPKVRGSQNATGLVDRSAIKTPSTTQPEPVQTTTGQPAAGQPGANQPEANQSATGQPPINQPEPGRSDTDEPTTNQPDTNKHSSSKDDDEPEVVKPTIADLVKLYCSQTAKDALSEEELEYLVDLVVNKLEPQAVNLLRNSFPAFNKAASNNEIGKEIGLYIYYDKGDQDGNADHESTDSSALASVIGRPTEIDGKKTYVYILNVNAAQTVVRDEDGNVVKDESGKATVAREGDVATDLQNTLVHEMFHAYMDDYNRTGMIGATSNDNLIIDLTKITKEQTEQFLSIHYPYWFVEGTASVVENSYQYRETTFDVLTAAVPSQNYAANSKEAIFYNYLTGRYEDGTLVGFQLRFASGGYQDGGNNISTTASRYVSGYLATMYLGNMAAASSSEIGSAVSTQDGKTTVSSEKIRLGLNSILERMHNGETLDQVIADISKDKSGTSLYTSTDDFEGKFISGAAEAQGYSGDDASLEFMSTFLGYLESINADGSRANGSILFDFDKNFTGPLDNSINATTDVLAIADKNTAVESTIPNSQALAGGGKSQSGSKGQTIANAANVQLAAAAKASDVSANENEADEDEADVKAAKASDGADSEAEAGNTEDEANVSDSASTLTLVEPTTTTEPIENMTVNEELPQAAKVAEPSVAESASNTEVNASNETDALSSLHAAI